MQARPTSLHEAMRLAMELESYNKAVRQSPSIRAVVVTEDSASNEKTPEYEQLKETLFVVTEGVQKLLPEKRAAPPKDDRLDVRNAAKCWNCGKVGNFRPVVSRRDRQSGRRCHRDFRETSSSRPHGAETGSKRNQ
ncbi:hypothetical protein LSAT2_008984 [Lamellibrachia satsuma]|nr:hypothetical protein LSAT2_008984 [Lamellibrachia satsuma]